MSNDDNLIKTNNRHLNVLNEIFPQGTTGYEYSYLNTVNKISDTDPTDISGGQSRGLAINKIVEKTGDNIVTTLNLIDNDIYGKSFQEKYPYLKNKYDDIKNSSNNYFENAGVPCYKNVPFTNMVVPMPVPRYNYIITNPKSDTHMQNILTNTDVSKSSKKYYYYEKKYQLYNEPIYFKDNGKTIDAMGKLKNRQTIKFNTENCWRRPDLKGEVKALSNSTTHRWNIFTTRDIFTEQDIRDGKTYSILLLQKDDGTRKILCNINRFIFELKPIRNELYIKQGTVYGPGHETINQNKRNISSKKRVRYFTYEDQQAREVYRKLRLTHIDTNKKEIKFENGDVFKLPSPKKYSEWRDKPETIILEYINFTRPVFNKCTKGTPADDNWQDVKGHVGEFVNVNSDKTISFPIENNHPATSKIQVQWGNWVGSGNNKIIKSAQCYTNGIIRLNDGSWFYNPAYVDVRIEFDNVRKEEKYSFGSNETINNLFDKRQMSCKFINLPTKGGICRKRPILTSDYWNIKNNYPELDEQCPWVKPMVTTKTRESFANINSDKLFNKKNMGNLFLGASGLLLLYLLFKLRQKSKH